MHILHSLTYVAYYLHISLHIHQACTVYCSYCLVPHPRAQVFTYHHLQPSPQFSVYCRKHQKSQPILVAWQTCDGLADWNQRKVTQYGGQQNHIQDVCLFKALVDDCRLTLIHPGWGWSTIRICKICKICTIWPEPGTGIKMRMSIICIICTIFIICTILPICHYMNNMLDMTNMYNMKNMLFREICRIWTPPKKYAKYATIWTPPFLYVKLLKILKI